MGGVCETLVTVTTNAIETNGMAHVIRPRISFSFRRGDAYDDTALRLGRYFGSNAQFWLDLQSQYDIAIVERSAAPKSPGASALPTPRDSLPLDRGRGALQGAIYVRPDSAVMCY